MAKRVDIGTYIGRQEFDEHTYLDLYNILIPIRNARLHDSHPVGSTLSHKTLQQLVPNLVLPKTPQKGDIAYALI